MKPVEAIENISRCGAGFEPDWRTNCAGASTQEQTAVAELQLLPTHQLNDEAYQEAYLVQLVLHFGS